MSNINLIPPDVDFVAPVMNITAVDAMRNLRNQLLKDNIDSYNAIRYASLTTEQQQELTAYRQALLDVPQQSTFPRNIAWPTKPSWMQ